jgi:hypothetical protein
LDLLADDFCEKCQQMMHVQPACDATHRPFVSSGMQSVYSAT